MARCDQQGGEPAEQTCLESPVGLTLTALSASNRGVDSWSLSRSMIWNLNNVKTEKSAQGSDNICGSWADHTISDIKTGDFSK